REKSVRLKTWEVQATLANHKSAILQVLKPHDAKKAKFCEYTQGSGLWVEDGYIKDYSVSPCWMKIGDYINQYAAYKPGDVLWVRETWKYLENAGENNGYVYRASENWANAGTRKYRLGVAPLNPYAARGGTVVSPRNGCTVRAGAVNGSRGYLQYGCCGSAAGDI
ncbi:MAG: hypothetical protein RR415_12755, partial [Ruthenibacterium sp.]